MAKQYFGRKFSGAAFDQAAPPEIIGKVVCSHPVEALHPAFETAVVSIHVLDMKDLLSDVLTG